MNAIKVVARYRDGKLLYGTTRNFTPEVRQVFHVTERDASPNTPPLEVNLSVLKAVFVVRTFEGDPTRHDSNDLHPQPGAGIILDVEFIDGEVVRGQSLTYNMSGAGFWLTPIDPGSNNLRIFVVRGATRVVKRHMPQTT